MDLHTYRNAVTLIRRIFDADRRTVPVITAFSGKPSFTPSEIKQPFVRAVPEECGVSSRQVAAFLRDIDSDRSLDMHGVSLYCSGKMLADASFGAYDRSVWHISYSECKSITGIAIGMLVDDGKLSVDDKLVDIFEKNGFGLPKFTHGALTVRDLLTMRTGVVMNEAASVTETEWVRCFFESSIKGTPGVDFSYNSINTYMLSAIVQRITGLPLDDFLRPRLFEPLGIENFFWERSPENIVKGGWGLYMLPEDIAKIGQLLLDGGVWKGSRLISEEWVREATGKQVDTPSSLGGYDYGYQIWIGRCGDSFLFNGMFGQNVIVYPGAKLMIVSNAGNNECFQQSSFFDLLDKYFGHGFAPAAAPLPYDREGENELASVLASLGRRGAYLDVFDCSGTHRSHLFSRRPPDPAEAADTLARGLAGLCYGVPENKGGGIGLMPLFMQSMQNCYSTGLCSIGFEYDGGLYVIFNEAGASFRLPVGFGTPKRLRLDFGAEEHLVAVTGAFAENEDGVRVLKLRISFLETAHSRLVKLFFEAKGLRVVFDESPGIDYLYEGLGVAVDGDKPSHIIRAVIHSSDSDFARYLVTRVFRPEIMLFPGECKPEK